MTTTRDDRALDDLVERMRSRFYGKYRGVVTDVDDPASLGRVKASIPSVLGDVEVWAMPCVPYAGPNVGFCFLPEQGSGVWIEFEGGDVSYPIWVGCYWGSGQIPDGVSEHVKMIVTTAPHQIVLDDDEGSVTVSDSNGNSITLDDTGISLSRGSQTLVIEDDDVSVNSGALEVQ